jgi:hypothetical protein
MERGYPPTKFQLLWHFAHKSSMEHVGTSTLGSGSPEVIVVTSEGGRSRSTVQSTSDGECSSSPRTLQRPTTGQDAQQHIQK